MLKKFGKINFLKMDRFARVQEVRFPVKRYSRSDQTRKRLVKRGRASLNTYFLLICNRLHTTVSAAANLIV